MKKLIHLTTTTFALMSSASVALAILSTHSIAYAGELPGSAYCQKALRPVTSGGAVREQLVLITKCNSKKGVAEQRDESSRNRNIPEFKVVK
jgi:hypothetical protein